MIGLTSLLIVVAVALYIIGINQFVKMQKAWAYPPRRIVKPRVIACFVSGTVILLVVFLFF